MLQNAAGAPGAVPMLPTDSEPKALTGKDFGLPEPAGQSTPGCQVRCQEIVMQLLGDSFRSGDEGVSSKNVAQGPVGGFGDADARGYTDSAGAVPVLADP